MPPFPPEQLDDHRCLTTLSILGSVTQVNLFPQFLIDVNAYELISRILSPSLNMYHKPHNKLATFIDLQKLWVNTTQEFLVKSKNSISK